VSLTGRNDAKFRSANEANADSFLKVTD